MSKKSAPTYLFLFRDPAGMPEPTPAQMQEIFGHWMTWIAALKKKRQYLAGEPLEPMPGKVLRGQRGAKATDGPFAEAKEVIGGYMLIRAKSFADAVKISKGSPIFDTGGSVEIRQIMPM